MRWCKRCADSECDEYGFATWKVVHQLASVRICHIHAEPLLSRCSVCGVAIGHLDRFRLPGEACPKCNGFAFEGSSIVCSDAYRTFVRDVVDAFEKQVDIYRDSSWSTWLLNFTSSFDSTLDAETAVIGYLCREWEVSSIAKILDLIQVAPGNNVRLFALGDRALCVRILLHRAMLNLCRTEHTQSRELVAAKMANSSSSRFAVVLREHAALLMFGERIVDALVMPLSVTDAASAAGLPYDRTYRAWKKVLKSMVAALGEGYVRELLPDERRIHKVAKVTRGQSLMVAYKSRVVDLLKDDPSLTRVKLWREHYKAMRYLSRNDYEWLVQMVGGNVPSRRSKPH